MRPLFFDGPRTRPHGDDAGLKASSQTGMTPRRGVLLINLGTPDRCDLPSVRRYLGEFLSDPAVIRLPTGLRWLGGTLGRLIALVRAPAAKRMYERIWTENGSPLRTFTEEQVLCLEEALPRGWRVFYAMRYGRPGISETLRRIGATGARDLVIVPMYPQFSDPTTGTAMRRVYEYLRSEGGEMRVTTRTCWYDDHGYINAQTKMIEQYARRSGLTPDNAFLLFSTHGLPVSYVERGDSYATHVARTVGLVSGQLRWPADRMSLAYQSRFGPLKWLTPYTDHVLAELARAGERKILVCPISFTADCLETLEEIDVRHRAVLEKAGAELFLCPALNSFGPFISALKHLVLRGPVPMGSHGREVRAVRPHKRHLGSEGRGIDSLVLVGMSIRGRLGAGRGPDMAYTSAEGLRCVKRSQCAVPALLRSLQERTELREAWLWNTCHRFELYGWLPTGPSPGGSADGRDVRAETVARVRQELFGNGTVHPECVNVLYGADAWHHILRTAVGLAGSLPGERDVLGQLRAAHRLAERAGTAGPLTRRLAKEVLGRARQLRRDTAWGRYDPEYSYAAMSRIVESSGLNLSACRIVVIGGSTTSAAALSTIRERFAVPSRQLTLLYRGHKHGGQLKVLRNAIGSGRRIRVQSYDGPGVMHEIAEADVVVFGVDREEAVLDADRLRACRDWSTRPLTIFDFNMFGSTTGLGGLAGVTLHDARRLGVEAAAFADRMCASEDFARAADAAEKWIVAHAMPSTADRPTEAEAGRARRAMVHASDTHSPTTVRRGSGRRGGALGTGGGSDRQ